VITQQQIDDNLLWDGLKVFGSFVLSHCREGQLADYKMMDLMQIPRLVPDIWVYDLRSDVNKEKLLLNFAGENICRLQGRNIIGDSDKATLRADPLFHPLLAHLEACIADKKTGYSKRYSRYTMEPYGIRYRYAETLFFPCSSDGENVNWGIGCVRYEIKEDGHENIYLQF